MSIKTAYELERRLRCTASGREFHREGGEPDRCSKEDGPAERKEGPAHARNVELRAYPGEEQGGRKEDHREHVVVGALVGVFRSLRVCRRCEFEPSGFARRLQPILPHRERRRGRRLVRERLRCQPGTERGLELRAEACLVERGERVPVLLPGVDPLDEGGNVDLELPVGHRRGAVDGDPFRRGVARLNRLSPGPLAGLVRRPRGRDTRKRQQSRCGELEAAVAQLRSVGPVTLCDDSAVSSPAEVEPLGESRWPPAAALVVYIGFTVAVRLWLPGEAAVRLPWLVPSLEVALLVALVAGDPARLARRTPWVRRIALTIVVALVAAALWATALLVYDLIKAHGVRQ